MKNKYLQSTVLTILVFMISLPAFSQSGPGGVGGHEDDIEPGVPILGLWLRAQDLVEEDGYTDMEEVDEWTDYMSGYDHVAVLPAGRDDILAPVLELDKINGYPWLNFGGQSFLVVEDHDILDGGKGFAIFAVVRRHNAEGITVNEKYNNQTILAKRKHWNSWSHEPVIEADSTGLQHAYEMRFDITEDKEGYTGGWSLVCFMNGNYPDGNATDVFTDNVFNDWEKNYVLDYAYGYKWTFSSSGTDYTGYGTVRVNGVATNRLDRGEGNPNVAMGHGRLINSDQPLYIGAAKLDPPGDFGTNEAKEDPFPEATEQAFLDGNIAEIIIFKGEFDSTTMLIVENYLGAKYGIPMENGEDRFEEVDNVHGLIGIGTMHGVYPHLESYGGGLGLAALNGSVDVDEWLFAGHDMAEHEEIVVNDTLDRWAREWKLEKTGALDAEIFFDFREAGLQAGVPADYVLLYRSTTEEDYTVIPGDAAKGFTTISFELSDDILINGYYTLGKKKAGPGAIRDFTLQGKLEIYPVPANETVNIKLKSNVTGTIHFRIYDFTGREIASFTDRKSSMIYNRSLSAGNWTKGLYLLEVEVNGHRSVKRIVIQ